MTLFPYYAAFRPEAEISKHLSSMTGDESHHLHTAMGVCANSIGVPETLRVCSECVQEDIETYGETYWHRSHQVPGVLVCPEHEVPLLKTEVPLRPIGRHEHVAANYDVDDTSLIQESVAKQDWEKAQKIAQKLIVLLEFDRTNPLLPDYEDIRQRLAEIGYENRRGVGKRLEQQFINFFGKSLLSQLEPEMMKNGLPWLRQLWQKRQRRLHPLRYTLLELFISDQPKIIKNELFGSGPWPCLNKLADHHHEPVIKEMTLVKHKNLPDLVTGKFSCSCGFAYTLDADQPDKSIPKTVVSFGPLYEQRAKELHVQGLSTRAIARKLGVDSKTVKRMINGKAESAQEQEKEKKIKKDQEAWLGLVKSHGEKGVKAIRKMNKALFTRLYRNCPEWLSKNSPKKQSATQSKHRVDWKARDYQLAAQVEMEAQLMLLEKPFKQVTRSALGRRLRVSSLFDKKLDLLPKTAEKLTTFCESLEQFQKRRIEFFRSSSERPLQDWEIIRKAGLRPEVFKSLTSTACYVREPVNLS